MPMQSWPYLLDSTLGLCSDYNHCGAPPAWSCALNHVVPTCRRSPKALVASAANPSGGGTASPTAAVDRPPLAELTNSPDKGFGPRERLSLPAPKGANGQLNIRRVLDASAQMVCSSAHKHQPERFRVATASSQRCCCNCSLAGCLCAGSAYVHIRPRRAYPAAEWYWRLIEDRQPTLPDAGVHSPLQAPRVSFSEEFCLGSVAG